MGHPSCLLPSPQNPVRVLLQLAPPGGWQGSWVGRRRASRKLLDAEKILFSTDWSGKVWVDPHHAAEVEVLFQAERWVQHRGGEAAAPKTLVYDIGGCRQGVGALVGAASSQGGC